MAATKNTVVQGKTNDLHLNLPTLEMKTIFDTLRHDQLVLFFDRVNLRSNKINFGLILLNLIKKHLRF